MRKLYHIPRGTRNSVRGYVSEVIADEVNPLWNYMVIRQGDSPLCISVPNVGKSSIPLHDLIDVDVELCGIAQPNYCAYRMFVGPHLELQSQSDITVLAPPGDPFAVPRLDDVLHVSPREIVKMRRRRCEGRVLAVWSKDRFLIVFRLNLSRAVWRMKKHSFVPVPLETPEKTCATQILLDKDGRERLVDSAADKFVFVFYIAVFAVRPIEGDKPILAIRDVKEDIRKDVGDLTQRLDIRSGL